MLIFPVDQFLVALLEDYQILLGEIRGSKEWTLHGRHIGHIPGSVARNEGRYLDVGNNFNHFVKDVFLKIHYTVWKFDNFSTTQILREPNFIA